MSIVISVLIGVVVGWLMSVITGTDSREGLFRNLTFGVVGAYLGGWLLSATVDSVDRGDFSLGVVAASSFGAAMMLLLAKRFS